MEEHDLNMKSFVEDDTFLVITEKVLTFSSTARFKRGSPSLSGMHALAAVVYLFVCLFV